MDAALKQGETYRVILRVSSHCDRERTINEISGSESYARWLVRSLRRESAKTPQIHEKAANPRKGRESAKRPRIHEKGRESAKRPRIRKKAANPRIPEKGRIPRKRPQIPEKAPNPQKGPKSLKRP